MYDFKNFYNARNVDSYICFKMFLIFKILNIYFIDDRSTKLLHPQIVLFQRIGNISSMSCYHSIYMSSSFSSSRPSSGFLLARTKLNYSTKSLSSSIFSNFSLVSASLDTHWTPCAALPPLTSHTYTYNLSFKTSNCVTASKRLHSKSRSVLIPHLTDILAC